MSVPTTLMDLEPYESTRFNQWKEKGISTLEQVSGRKYYEISEDPVQKAKDEEKMRDYNKIKQDLQTAFKPALYIAIRRTYDKDSDELIGKLLMGGIKNLIEKNPSQFPILDKDINTSSVLNANFISTELLQHVIDTLKELNELPSPKGHHCFFYEMLALFYVTLLGRRTFNRAMRKTDTPVDVQLVDYETKYSELEKAASDYLTLIGSSDIARATQVAGNVFSGSITPVKTVGSTNYYLLDDKYSVKRQPYKDTYMNEGLNITNLLVNKSTRHYVPFWLGSITNNGNTETALVNEFVSGPSLDDLIKKGITNEEKKRIEQNIRKVVNAFHDAGFLHLDIQPENIIIRMDNNTIVPDEEDPVVFINFEQSYWMSGSLVAYTSVDQFAKKGNTIVADYGKVTKLTKLAEPIGVLGTPKFKSPAFQNWEKRFSAKDYDAGTTANPEMRKYAGEKYYFTQNDDNYAAEETIKLLNGAGGPSSTPRWTKPKGERLMKRDDTKEDEEYDLNFYAFCADMYTLRSQQPV